MCVSLVECSLVFSEVLYPAVGPLSSHCALGIPTMHVNAHVISLSQKYGQQANVQSATHALLHAQEA